MGWSCPGRFGEGLCEQSRRLGSLRRLEIAKTPATATLHHHHQKHGTLHGVGSGEQFVWDEHINGWGKLIDGWGLGRATPGTDPQQEGPHAGRAIFDDEDDEREVRREFERLKELEREVKDDEHEEEMLPACRGGRRNRFLDDEAGISKAGREDD